MAFEQLESVWPVHGSVLVQDDVVYCVAGRSMFLDGGMRFLRLDPKTGQKLSETILDDRDPSTGNNLQEKTMVLNMPVALPDILSSDGRYVYMRSQPFDLQGNRQELGPHSGNPVEQGSAQESEFAHLFCPTGFIDNTWFHRSYWIFGSSFAGGWNGYHEAGKYAPAGRILVFDDSSVYGFGRKPQYYRWTTPLEYRLFAASKNPEIIEMDRKMGSNRKSVNTFACRWVQEVPIQVRAMVLAAGTLFIAGPPDIVDEEEVYNNFNDPRIHVKLEEQSAALDGKKGAELWAVSVSDGKKLSEYKLDSLPVFDGMAAARGRLYISQQDGKIICMGN